jgi:hypothetical protein
MSLLPIFQWLASTRLSVAMSDSVRAFAIVEMVHLLGLSLLGGTTLLLNLRLLDLRLRRRPAQEVARELYPYTLASLGIMLVSGAFLLIDGPLRYYGNSAFRLKMVLLGAAMVCSAVQYHQVLGSRLTASRWLQQVTAVASLSLWLSVGLAGRAIGFL